MILLEKMSDRVKLSERGKYIIFVDPDDYLSFKFGEYMNLPPEGERKAHPVSDIKLLVPDFNKERNNDK